MAKKNYEAKIDIPEFYNDPLYKQSQGVLFPFGTNMLSGNLPDYYKPIGQSGGQEFEGMMSLINRDTATKVAENMTRRNISRGGLGANIVAKSMADVGKTLRWEDYSRALTGKQNLLGMGLNTVQGVGASALNFMNQRNNFNMSAAGLNLDMAKANASLKAQQDAQKNAMWAQILSSAIGAAGTIGGFMVGGPVGAGVGASLGSAAGSGLSGLTMSSGLDYGSLSNMAR